MTSMMSNSLKRARSRKNKSLPPMGKYVPVREAHIVTRIPLGDGTVAVNVSGQLSTIGGFPVAGSLSVYEFQMKNFGWLQDLANHFAYWKLHRAVLQLTPAYELVSGSTAFANGIFELAIQDDPFLQTSTSVGVGSTLENRTSGEFEVSRPFRLDYKPVGRQADWLFTDAGASTAASTQRQTSAGVLIGSTALASSLVSATVMRATLTLDVSLKGSRAFSIVTDLSSDTKEEKKFSAPAQAKTPASAATAAGGSVASGGAGDGYELVEIQRRPSSLGFVPALRRV